MSSAEAEGADAIDFADSAEVETDESWERIHLQPPNADEFEASCLKWSDGELVAALVRQRGDAFAELYRRHVASVSAVTRMVLGSEVMSDDVVDEVFIALWFAPEKFDPSRGSVLAFLRLKAKGRSIDVLRSETSRYRREEGVRSQSIISSEEIDATLIAAEAAEEMRRAVATLPPLEHESIDLAFFHGMSYAAVALHLGIAEGTVKARIRRGLRRLRLNGDIQLRRVELGAMSSEDGTSATSDAAELGRT